MPRYDLGVPGRPPQRAERLFVFVALIPRYWGSPSPYTPSLSGRYFNASLESGPDAVLIMTTLVSATLGARTGARSFRRASSHPRSLRARKTDSEMRAATLDFWGAGLVAYPW